MPRRDSPALAAGPARRATYLYHPYELAPTAAELTSWLDQAAQLVTQLQTATAPVDQV